MTKLICFGEILYDMYSDDKILGGAPLNVASIAASMKIHSGIVSAVGARDYEAITEELASRCIDSFVQKSDRATGKALIKLDAQGNPRFHIDKESAFDYIKECDVQTDSSAYIYFGTLAQRKLTSRSTLRGLLNSARGTVIYDLNLREGITNAEDIISSSMPFVHVLKINRAERELIQNMCGSVNEIFSKHRKLKYIITTLGAEGAIAYQRDNTEIRSEAMDSDVVDTTGCGDAFTAAIIYGMSHDLDAQRMLDMATKAASQVARFKGAFSSEIARAVWEYVDKNR